MALETIAIHSLHYKRNAQKTAALTSLTSLHWVDSGELTESLEFVTSLRHLHEVRLQNFPVVIGGPWGSWRRGHLVGEEYAWNAASLCAIMQARLLIEETADCHVKLQLLYSL